jgi:hypothetical protein
MWNALIQTITVMMNPKSLSRHRRDLQHMDSVGHAFSLTSYCWQNKVQKHFRHGEERSLWQSNPINASMHLINFEIASGGKSTALATPAPTGRGNGG